MQSAMEQRDRLDAAFARLAADVGQRQRLFFLALLRVHAAWMADIVSVDEPVLPAMLARIDLDESLKRCAESPRVPPQVVDAWNQALFRPRPSNISFGSADWVAHVLSGLYELYAAE